MSAYAHQMEREYSAQSLMSRAETGSQYVVESGFYMTSFAATIFIGGIVTIGLLLITLVIALTVMLQSCQSRSDGVVEIAKPSDDYFSNCKIFALHAELNSLEADEFPKFCRGLAVRYVKDGQYARDLRFTISLAESYFSALSPVVDGLNVVLLDIDDILASSPQYTNLSTHQIDQLGCSDCIEEAKHLKHALTLKLFTKLQASGWRVILLSRKPEGERNATTELLISAGFTDWSSLIMRMDDEMQMDSREYLSRRRTRMQKEGFHITGLISSQMDALTGQSLGRRIFKLPNPIYYSFDHQSESRETDIRIDDVPRGLSHH